MQNWDIAAKIGQKPVKTLIFTLKIPPLANKNCQFSKLNISRSKAALKLGPGSKESLKPWLLRGKNRFSLTNIIVEILRLREVTLRGRFETHLARL